MTAQERRNKAHIDELRREDVHGERVAAYKAGKLHWSRLTKEERVQAKAAEDVDVDVSIAPKADRRADRCRLVVVVRCPHCGLIDPENELNKPERYTRAERRVFTRCDNCGKEFEIRDLDITDAQHELLVALGEA